MGRLLLLGSGDRVPNTPAASLRDAHLTDKSPSQSLPGPFGKVEFPNEPIGRQRGRALVIGVLFRVESSKQPWSRGGGEDSVVPAPSGRQGGVGKHPRQKEPPLPQQGGREGGAPESQHQRRHLEPPRQNC